MENKLYLSWEELEDLVTKLAEQITASGFKPDCLVGIAVGGLIPLAILSRRLNNKNVTTITARSYENGVQNDLHISTKPGLDLTGKSVLLIDEIADSGRTLTEIGKLLKETYSVGEIKIATVAVRSDKSKLTPEFHVLTATQWIVFPWEKKDPENLQDKQ